MFNLKVHTTILCASFLLFAFFLLGLLIVSLAQGCQPVPEPTAPFAYVSADRSTTARRTTDACAFRYFLSDTYPKLDDKTQKAAIREGFDCWQRACKNITFLDFSATDRVDLQIRFVSPAEMPVDVVDAPIGLLRQPANVTAALRRDAGKPAQILLNNVINWTPKAITKAVAYHAGLYAGVPTSNVAGALMSLTDWEMPVSAMADETAAINQLYPGGCADLKAKFLPLTLDVGGPVNTTIRLDQQGTLSVSALGQIRVGI